MRGNSLTPPQIIDAETKYGVKTPFQSIYTLERIVQRASNAEDIAWSLSSILFGLETDIYVMSDITERTLTGKGSAP